MITLPAFAKIEKLTHGFSTSLPDSPLVQAQQVHADKTALVTKADTGKTISGVDGLITRDQNLTLVIRTADCLPILIYHPGDQAIGVIHAGYQGINQKIHLQAVSLFNSAPQDLIVGLGPCVCQNCYHRHFDLRGIVTRDLLKAGVTQLDQIDICTCEDTRFPSHQRSYNTGEPERRLYGFLVRH